MYCTHSESNLIRNCLNFTVCWFNFTSRYIVNDKLEYGRTKLVLMFTKDSLHDNIGFYTKVRPCERCHKEQCCEDPGQHQEKAEYGPKNRIGDELCTAVGNSFSRKICLTQHRKNEHIDHNGNCYRNAEKDFCAIKFVVDILGDGDKFSQIVPKSANVIIYHGTQLFNLGCKFSETILDFLCVGPGTTIAESSPGVFLCRF
mmetsp:Transcript_24401/g.44001  ORF Transcript_24401/g.44001 Transcript_24401/m.44001 type:complete len:201 (-) Transcript_24401:598-1200(-)